MKEYFELQFVMTTRKIKDAGINPVLGYLLGLLVFVFLSEYTFNKTTFARYLLILVCIGFQYSLSGKNRTDFLQSAFRDHLKNRIRVLENLLISLPFVITLVCKSFFLEVIILILCSIIIALTRANSALNLTIPTPFSRNSFEFSIGFRKTLLIFPLSYAMAATAIVMDNLNLGIFSMLLIFLTTLSYYSKPENEYYVWIHADTPKSFLIRKLKTASKNSFLLTLPISAGLLLFYPDEYGLILLLLLIGILALHTMILAKYSAFPSEMNLPEGIIIAFALSFPPLTILAIPYFYTKSIKKLSLILHD